MPTTKTYTVYQFDELSPEGQQKAIDRYRYINVEAVNWYDYLIEQFTEDMQKLGIDILTRQQKHIGGYTNGQWDSRKETFVTEANVYFTGFSSQGDGASFEADVNVAAWLKANGLANKYRKVYNFCKREGYQVGIRKTSHQYSHQYTMGIDWEYTDDIGDMRAVAKMILDDCRELAKKLYRQLESEYYADIEDEAVKDTLSINDWEFTEDGEMD